ncbi:hypothetical protein P2A93_14080, partial [Xanthomonas perforans]
MSSASPLPLAWVMRPWVGAGARPLAALFRGYAPGAAPHPFLALVVARAADVAGFCRNPDGSGVGG